MAEFGSEKGDIPQADLNKMDLISSIVTTFESNDLHTRNAINFRFDQESGYIFMDILAIHNGVKLADIVFGFDREKVMTMAQNIIKYFEDKNPSPSDR